MENSPQSPASDTHPSAPCAATTPTADGRRRGIVTGILALALGGLTSLTPLVSGLIVFFDPLWRRSRRSAGGNESGGLVVRLTSLDAVPDDGLPHMFPVVADVNDAWTRLPREKLGAVYVRREQGSRTVQVFQAECPHAGCFVMFEGLAFKCPCHNSAFTAAGARESVAGKDNPAPRDLDTLAVDEERLAASGEIWIRYQTFFTGRHDKKPRA